MNAEIDEPIDLIHNSLGKNVIIKCKNDRELRGKLHAYDAHLNLLLSDVVEKINFTESPTQKTKNKNEDIVKKNFGLLFLRGDLVILIAPSNK